MDDVKGCIGDLRQADGPIGRLTFQFCRPRSAMKDGIGLTTCECRGDYGVDGDAIFGMDHYESTVDVARSMAWRMSLSVA